MGVQDFSFEFHSDLPNFDERLRIEAEERLRDLRAGHTDLIGAAVAVNRIAHGETPHWFRARVVAYARPENIVAVEKDEVAEVALKNALKAVERQVREKREKLQRR
jgi:ribosome-associated translation inhibitor RaiA